MEERVFGSESESIKVLMAEIDAILDLTKEGIQITDSNGVIIRYNKAIERIDGIKAEDVLGKSMLKLVSDGVFSNSVTLDVLKRQCPVTNVQKVRGKDGLFHELAIPVAAIFMHILF